MIEYLASRGFGHGSGLLSPTCDQFLLNIPKNASSYLLDWGTRQGWTTAIVGDTCDWHRCEELIVVLRDPLERWISGIAQYINSYILSVIGPNTPMRDKTLLRSENRPMPAAEFIELYNQATERLIFDQINRFDDHVWPQLDFFKDLLPAAEKKYFYVDKNLTKNISQHLSWPIYHDLNGNQGESSDSIKLLQQFFKKRLIDRPDLTQQVKNAYAEDYYLIQSVLS
jgi:hypothetical protein